MGNHWTHSNFLIKFDRILAGVSSKKLLLLFFENKLKPKLEQDRSYTLHRIHAQCFIVNHLNEQYEL